uniref:Uncharacterized protein n=1 Tax=Arundo donax TaxID=35708 RepID=A0A0A9EB12_ARUDO
MEVGVCRQKVQTVNNHVTLFRQLYFVEGIYVHAYTEVCTMVQICTISNNGIRHYIFMPHLQTYALHS